MTDLNVDTETGQQLNRGRYPRFSLWMALLVFSSITLGASVEIVSRVGVRHHDGSHPTESSKYRKHCRRKDQREDSTFLFLVYFLIMM